MQRAIERGNILLQLDQNCTDFRTLLNNGGRDHKFRDFIYYQGLKANHYHTIGHEVLDKVNLKPGTFLSNDYNTLSLSEPLCYSKVKR